ncbi:MAG: alpha/beta fold hydrolase [Promethearchaeia archaeon]
MNNPRVYGQPPFKLALIHGGPGACGEMSSVAKELSSERGVLEPLQTALSVKAQIGELKKLLIKYGSPFTLVGFSWGAWLSLLTAAEYPSLVNKVVIIGCAPFEEKYADQIFKTRLKRLNEREREEFRVAINALNNQSFYDISYPLKKLRKLTRKTDQYAPLNNRETIFLKKDVYNKVWKEAAVMRKTGKLLTLIRNVSSPVIAVHGNYDPHPAEGVKKPLSRVLKKFRFIEIEECGHKPWIEKHARNFFFKILKREI